MKTIVKLAACLMLAVFASTGCAKKEEPKPAKKEEVKDAAKDAAGDAADTTKAETEKPAE